MSHTAKVKRKEKQLRVRDIEKHKSFQAQLLVEMKIEEASIVYTQFIRKKILSDEHARLESTERSEREREHLLRTRRRSKLFQRSIAERSWIDPEGRIPLGVAVTPFNKKIYYGL